MLEQFFQGLTEVLKPHAFGIMLIGMVIGYAVGILPGLGGAVTLALMLPFTFMLTLLGVAFVASLSGGAVLKGIIAGGIGLLLSLIGLDQQTGIQRATFGQLELWDGIGLVPVTIGMFGMPEVIDLAVRGTSIA